MASFCCKPEGPRKKRKSKKGNKDPNAPKRPQSAYFLWLNENRDRIREENPGISITEVSKIAGELWKEVEDRTVSLCGVIVIVIQCVLVVKSDPTWSLK